MIDIAEIDDVDSSKWSLRDGADRCKQMQLLSPAGGVYRRPPHNSQHTQSIMIYLVSTSPVLFFRYSPPCSRRHSGVVLGSIPHSLVATSHSIPLRTNESNPLGRRHRSGAHTSSSLRTAGCLAASVRLVRVPLPGPRRRYRDRRRLPCTRQTKADGWRASRRGDYVDVTAPSCSRPYPCRLLAHKFNASNCNCRCNLAAPADYRSPFRLLVPVPHPPRTSVGAS